jgi:hypothetical protein
MPDDNSRFPDEPSQPVDGTPAPRRSGALPGSPQPVGAHVAGPDAEPASPRATRLKRVGGAVLVAAVLFGLRAVTADDGTHGIEVGQCVAQDGDNDFKKADCGAPDAVGKVTYIEKDTATTETAALALCKRHGADGAFVSAESDGGNGTVVCVSDST